MTIDQAVALIPSWQGAARVEIGALPGGVTNLNYRVDVDGEAFVVRLAAAGAERLGIDRAREYRCHMAASRAGVAPEVVHYLPDAGVMVTRFLPGRSLSPETMALPDVSARAAGAMRRYHGGPAFDGIYSPFRTIEAYVQTARHDGAALPADIGALHAQTARIERALGAAQALCPCHNDLWGSNLIDDGAQVRIVDWEYAGMGDGFFDLANYAIYGCPSDTTCEALLGAYFGTVTATAFARLALLQIVAELREALWYVVARLVSPRWPEYADLAHNHFARCRARLADSRLPDWLNRVAGISLA
jgi:thiamine kinase-like enzyme